MRKLLMVGGGGHCRSIIDSILSSGLYDELGIIDPDEKASVRNIPVVGNDDCLKELKNAGWTDAFISVGSVGNTGLRHRLYKIIKEIGYNVPSIADPSAVISGDVKIGEGCFIGKKAVVNTGSSLGICSIVNTGAIIEHDCRIGSFVHVSPGAVLCGQVTVGDDSHIGAASVVRQCIRIEDRVLIGMGSVVVMDIPQSAVAYGNPCKVRSK